LTVTASRGAFGWARQTVKGTAVAPEYWHRAHAIALGAVESRDVLDPEIGGTILPTGVIKTGVHGAGAVTISPRLESDIGWLFHAMMGSSSTTADTPETDIHRHTFAFDTDEASLPWLSLYKWMPGSTAAEDIGMRITDGKVASMRLALPGRGRVGMQLGFLGIKPEAIANPATNADPVWVTSFEDENSIPITSAVANAFEFPGIPGPGAGTAVSALGCTVDFTNGLTDPLGQEAVIGSYYPDDIGVLGRAIIIRFPMKLTTYDYWARAMLNETDASLLTSWTAWSPVTFSSGWECAVASPGNITGYSNPYKLTLSAAEVEWVVDPIAMVGNQAMIVNFTGTVVYPESGTSFRIQLDNELANYTWSV